MDYFLTDQTFEAAYREAQAPRGMIFERHFHLQYEILMVLNGEISVVIENKQYAVSAGSIVVFTPSAYHSVFVNQPTEYARVTVRFSHSEVPKEIQSAFFQAVSVHPVLKGKYFTQTAEEFKKVLFAREKDKLSPLLLSMMTRFFYAAAYLENETAKEEDVSTSKNLTAIVEYVNAHLGEKLTLEDIANSVFLSQSSISHLFKSKMKIGIKQYILQKKMAHATLMMANGVPASEAAKIIGYENYSNFYTMYKKVVGVSPSEKKKGGSRS